jgi:type I restriction enzyme S subunit
LALQKYPPKDRQYLPVIKIAQLLKGNVEGADKASLQVPPDYVVQDGDILFSWSGSLEVVMWCVGSGALNPHLFKVTSDLCPKWFFYHWIREHLPHFQHIAAGKATTTGHIQRHHLSDARVVVPPQRTLPRIDLIIAPLMQRAIANNLEGRTLTNVRNALLPRLLSGRICLKQAEKTVAAVIWWRAVRPKYLDYYPSASIVAGRRAEASISIVWCSRP